MLSVVKCIHTKKKIASFKREREENAAGPSNPSPHKKRSSKFDFRTLCLVCGEEANEDVEKRKRQEYRRKIKQVSTLSFKDNIIKTAESRDDRLGKIVRDRVNFEYDLVAAEAKYHDNCLISFNKYKSGGSVGRPHDENIRLAMEEIFYYIENNNDCQFTLTELVNAITSDFIPDAKTIIYKLTARYGKDIIITTKHAKLTIICFLDTQKKMLCQSWYENKKSNVSEERLRVVEAAAAIIREDIRSVLINTDTYPPVNQMFDNINKNIPQSLLFFLKQIIIKNKKGNINELENKCTALSHAIMKCTRPRSFLSRLLLGISVFLHRRYGSKRLLDMLSNLGFSNTYKEVLLYESAVVNHPQPKILSPAAGAFIQYSADNADINIYTIDGHNTVHIMGVIQIVTPKSAVIVDEEIQRLRIIPAAKDIAAIAHVPLQMYDNFGDSGLSKIDVENILSDNVSIKSFINKIDFLWMYGKWKTVSDVPGWNGFIEYLTKENNKFSTSRILFLPFIHHPASNLNTIYTTLNSIHDNMKFHGHEACVVTFDQPLFIKAREIVAASEPGSELSKIIIRLGGFHLIMSFLGSIGYLMAGSGLKEVLSVVYAPKSVDKMLDGHAYARAVRGHILLHLALSKFVAQDMEIDDHTDDYIQRYIEQIIVQNVSYEDVEDSTVILESYIEQFNGILKKIQNRGPTAKLWVQYFYMVSIVKDFIRSERLGDWDGHLKALKKMLPFFHASGHFLYAKSAYLYLQDMLKLKNNMDEQAFKKFIDGFFTVRRSNKFNCGTWSDMVIEQSLMKSMKSEGGVSRGRSTQESVLSKWIYGMYAMNTICEDVEKFCNISLDTVDQHVDTKDSRIKRDNDDVNKIIEWLTIHNPFPQTNKIMSISNGIIGNDEINCCDAYEIGKNLMNKMVGLKFDNFKFKRANRVLPLLSVKSSIKVYDHSVPIDPLLLFQRISLNTRFQDNLDEYLKYELSPYPLAIFDDVGMRKTNKSTLFKCFKSSIYEMDTSNATYIIDGGFLLHRVIWHQDDTFQCIFNKYIVYLKKHFGSNVIVVFDGYNDNSKNIKAMEQFRRSEAFSGSFEVFFNETMKVPISQEKFLSNRSNKNRFISTLMQKLENINIASKQAQDDADVLIIETAIEEAYTRKTVVVGEDVDLLVILIARTPSQKHIFFLKPGKGNVDTKIYSSTNSMDHYNFGREHILFLHAVTGCDTTSTFFNKGKVKVLKLLENRPDLQSAAAVFKNQNCSVQDIFEHGIKFILAMYGAQKQVVSIDNYRYITFAKLTRNNKPVKLSSLPPTKAPPNSICFEFITSCKKIGIKCSIICGHCRGQSCFNSSSDNALDDNIDTFDVLSADLTEEDNTYNFEKNEEHQNDEEEEEEEEMHEDESDDD
ncbi:hypothetical protein QTP88_020338 [Uroleucon formosanum]